MMPAVRPVHSMNPRMRHRHLTPKTDAAAEMLRRRDVLT